MWRDGLVRTTVDIADAVDRQLKSRAAREGSTTRALIGLTAKLASAVPIGE
jgi:hypothetical protein